MPKEVKRPCKVCGQPYDFLYGYLDEAHGLHGERKGDCISICPACLHAHLVKHYYGSPSHWAVAQAWGLPLPELTWVVPPPEPIIRQLALLED